ncbi:MAG: putative integral membrane protein [Anaerolineae bacterium]|jgi:RsiW-degrading membrane proteinase PrsW (M82 family)|nr:MAG: putative integral membrane protein [Anaerolineae bacterium]
MLPLLISILLGFIPMLINAAWVYWLDRYEQEPRRLLGVVFVWGAVVAAFGALIVNSLWEAGLFLLTNSERLSSLSTYIISAPLIEESLKGIAVLIIFLRYRHEFDSILDGIVYASVVALGFAATENTFYIYEKGYLAAGITGLVTLTFLRVIVVGWQHPFYTAFIGIGFAASRLARAGIWRVLAPLLGFSVAVFTHSLHNLLSSVYPSLLTCLLGSLMDWSGWLAMFAFVLYTIYRERHLLENTLKEEVDLGILSEAQYYKTTSFTHRVVDPFINAFNGQYALVRRFHQLCGELAHKKAQSALLDDQIDYQQWIDQYRSELSKISRLLSG